MQASRITNDKSGALTIHDLWTIDFQAKVLGKIDDENLTHKKLAKCVKAAQNIGPSMAQDISQVLGIKALVLSVEIMSFARGNWRYCDKCSPYVFGFFNSHVCSK